MKKTYITPTAKTVELNLSAIILAGSIVSPEGSVLDNILPGGGEGGADTEDIL